MIDCVRGEYMRVQREKIQLPDGHSFRVLRWSRHLRDVECIVAPDRVERVASEGTHWHFHVEMELTLFEAGEGTRFVGDHIGPFAAGDLVLLGERVPHYWHTRGHSSGISVQWNFPESHPFWAFPETLEMADLFKRASRGLRISGKTAALVTVLLKDITRTGGVEQLALLLRLFALIAKAPDAERSFLSVRSFALSAESHYQQAITRAIRYLIAHFREEVRLETLLQLTDLSRPTFARQFKHHSGHSFSEFLNRLRLQTACRELAESDRGVLEIALASGFTQISFFNRLFRRLMKCSPTMYRDKQRRKHTAGKGK
jgi:AraC-like DNA-binding protein